MLYYAGFLNLLPLLVCDITLAEFTQSATVCRKANGSAGERDDKSHGMVNT